MKRQRLLTAATLAFGAITFWLSWYFMPDPGTTDAIHILQIVKTVRIRVFTSVILQIISSVLFISSLFTLTTITGKQKTITLTGSILFATGAMGSCADAFFHLLAFFMTDNSVTAQQDVVRVMTFMQTTGVLFLIPLLIPIFIGSLVLAIGLNKQRVVSKIPQMIIIFAFVATIAGGILSNAVFQYHGPLFSLSVLGIFSAGNIAVARELVQSV